MSKTFGKFPSLSDFLESCKAADKKRELKEALAAPVVEAARKIRKKQQKPRDLIEVDAVLKRREPDDTDATGGKHYRLRIGITRVRKNDPDVSADLLDAKKTGRDVVVAIRFGDALGIQEKVKGLTKGAGLHLRGEWITREKAYAHGGERMSVLHFTHHPMGFVCTEIQCYA